MIFGHSAQKDHPPRAYTSLHRREALAAFIKKHAFYVRAFPSLSMHGHTAASHTPPQMCISLYCDALLQYPVETGDNLLIVAVLGQLASDVLRQCG
jgi:hypothetical protein